MFADLRPYICTFPGCTDDLVQFTKRSLWADHEFKEHRTKKTWVCQECQVEFSNPQFWEQHIQRFHGASYPGSKRRIAISTAYRQREIPAEHEKCFLCDTIPGKSRRAFVKHVGQHKEEIALVALPRQIEDDSGESTTTNEEGKDSLASLGSRSSKSPVALAYPRRSNILSTIHDEIEPRGYAGMLSENPGAEAPSDSQVYHNKSRGMRDEGCLPSTDEISSPANLPQT